MKQVIEYYGGAIIAGIVALAVMGVFTAMPYQDARGVAQILGGVVSDGLQEVETEDNQREAFSEYMGTSVPEIVVADSYACVAGRWTMVKDCLTVQEETGDALLVRVLSGESTGISSGRVFVSGSRTRIFCTTPGVYWIYASVETENGRVREIMVKVIASKEAEI